MPLSKYTNCFADPFNIRLLYTSFCKSLHSNKALMSSNSVIQLSMGNLSLTEKYDKLLFTSLMVKLLCGELTRFRLSRRLFLGTFVSKTSSSLLYRPLADNQILSCFIGWRRVSAALDSPPLSCYHLPAFLPRASCFPRVVCSSRSFSSLVASLSVVSASSVVPSSLSSSLFISVSGERF